MENKAILMSIRPQYVAKILNGEKTIEVRKKFPKDYVGWVYIYVTKGKPYITGIYNYEHKIVYGDIENKNHNINGKVVARFWCDKVSPTYDFYEEEICDLACITKQEYLDYFGYDDGYAIHITNLEIFDKPKELSEFKSKLHIKGGCKNCPQYTGFPMPYCATCDFLLPLTRAPQSWCYVEV